MYLITSSWKNIREKMSNIFYGPQMYLITSSWKNIKEKMPNIFEVVSFASLCFILQRSLSLKNLMSPSNQKSTYKGPQPTPPKRRESTFWVETVQSETVQEFSHSQLERQEVSNTSNICVIFPSPVQAYPNCGWHFMPHWQRIIFIVVIWRSRPTYPTRQRD